jgi:hypothetical protein
VRILEAAALERQASTISRARPCSAFVIARRLVLLELAWFGTRRLVGSKVSGHEIRGEVYAVGRDVPTDRAKVLVAIDR